MSIIDNLEKLLADGQDSAVLRFSLGNACLQQKRFPDAIDHLSRAIEFDPEYSAAWKLLARALVEVGRKEEAIETYRKGIAAAQQHGDIQAVKEMTVFLKRIEKT